MAGGCRCGILIYFISWCDCTVQNYFPAEGYFLGLIFPTALVYLCFNIVSFLLFLQEHHIQTNHGAVSVAVYGDHDKPALITYPDVALNRKYNTLKCTSFL